MRPGQSRGPAQREKVVQQQIVRLLRSLGAAVYVLGTRRPRGDHPGTCMTPGLPDVYVLLSASPLGAPACGLWIEVKAKGGRLSPEQAGFRDQCRAAGIPHVVGGLDAVLDWLVQAGYLRGEHLSHDRQERLGA